jgi:hypothetical protein
MQVHCAGEQMQALERQRVGGLEKDVGMACMHSFSVAKRASCRLK